MCTGFVKKGKDLIFAYNLDVSPEVFDYAVYKNERYFTVGIKIGSTLYFTHGVNCYGNFGNLPFMNGERFAAIKGARERIDLLVDRLIRNKYSFADVEKIIATKHVVNGPSATMHSLFCNCDGKTVLVEPGYGNKVIDKNYAVIANFPILANLQDYSNPYYGKDRFDICENVLSEAGDDFDVKDALSLLESVKQAGQYGTRVSFVYSSNENAVYYCLDGDFANVFKHFLTSEQK